MPSPRAIDLFSGAGGLSLGLRNAGFDVCAAVESDPWAARTYRQNLGAHVMEGSINGLSVEELLGGAGLAPGECELLAGGPPCQGFSVQRRGPDDDPRNELVLEFLRFVEGVRPRFFLLENVSGLMSKRGKSVLARLVRHVQSLDYQVHIQKLDAVDFGVPQVRVRAILVGERISDAPSRFRFPDPLLPASHRRTVRQAIGDLPSPPMDGRSHADVPNHAREAKLSATNLERLRHIPPGGGRTDLPEHLQLPCHVNNPRHRHLDVYGRLAWDQPSVTITARFDSFSRGRFGHPEDNRSLTIREGARLQTFPDWFIFHGNREECAKQVGNAVPPVLAEALGRAIARALAGEGVAGPQPSPQQLTLSLKGDLVGIA